MRIQLMPAAVTAVALLASSALSQTYSTLCYETFDYPAGNLGGGNAGPWWFTSWYSGGGGNDASVVYPGVDAIGGQARTNFENAGSYRSPKTGPWTPTIGSGFNFGGDAPYSVWVSFSSYREPGSGDQYGGLSLHTGFVGEKLFIGAPFQTNNWGFGVPGCCSYNIPGSDATVPTRVVVRIDYQAGDERARMWLNPAVAHPSTTPDLDVTVTNHNWNEIRLQAGASDNGITGWNFDDILIEVEDGDPTALLSNNQVISLSAGGSQNFEMFGGVENTGDLYFLLGSVSGTAPGLPLPPVGTLPLNFDAYTNLTLTAPNTPPLSGSFGTLNGDGKANPVLTLPAGTNPNLAGIVANHAYVVIDISTGIPTVVKISNAEPVTLTN
jgi:hypothetical protein